VKENYKITSFFRKLARETHAPSPELALQLGSATWPFAVDEGDPCRNLSVEVADLLKPYLDHKSVSITGSVCVVGSMPQTEQNQSDSESRERQSPAAVWLDPTADKEDGPAVVLVMGATKKLIKEAKKLIFFSVLMQLCALKHFIELQEHYTHNLNVKNPGMRASYAVSISIGKGPYFTHKVPMLHNYIKEFHTLLPMSAGKHHAHPSLLNNEHIAWAVYHYLTVLANSKVMKQFLQCSLETHTETKQIDHTIASNEAS
jgi:hypothetical protein